MAYPQSADATDRLAEFAREMDRLDEETRKAAALGTAAGEEMVSHLKTKERRHKAAGIAEVGLVGGLSFLGHRAGIKAEKKAQAVMDASIVPLTGTGAGIGEAEAALSRITRARPADTEGAARSRGHRSMSPNMARISNSHAAEGKMIMDGASAIARISSQFKEADARLAGSRAKAGLAGIQGLAQLESQAAQSELSDIQAGQMIVRNKRVEAQNKVTKLASQLAILASAAITLGAGGWISGLATAAGAAIGGAKALTPEAPEPTGAFDKYGEMLP